ncbi:zinc-dependent metalloprotease [Flaviaesturariibacter amylovorans]|uniref:Zinc-dependent metalloprotease n=1 Tax=Flaviaesturariibacter amylovorans TaxID=1084520 RepID=A0ABP8HPI5_9BACT
MQLNVRHLAAFSLLLALALPAGAQKTPALPPALQKLVSASDTTKPKKPVWPLADKTKGSRRTDGLFTLYQDTTSGGLQLYIRKDQLSKEYIYQSYALSGPTALLLNQSIYRSNFIFRVTKAFDRLEFSRVNTAFWYDPESPVSRTRDIDKPEAVVSSERILGEDSSGYLVSADGLFLSERFDPVKPPTVPSFFSLPSFSLGSLNPFKSKYVAVKTFPANTDVVVDLAYDNPNAAVSGGSDITDPRYVRVRLQHSFIELPQNNFRPRRDDPRVGYFMHAVNDQTSISATPWRDVIHRWHLVKKDSTAAVSEPETPLTFWIENTTPLEYRETVRAAILQWNTAFEGAGFRNAIRVEQMPDTATWDPADLRYNVVRWVSSAAPPYGAIGQYTTNPRTGEILGADVTIEWYTGSAAPVLEELLLGRAGARAAAPAEGGNYMLCSLAGELKAGYMAGATALEAAGAPPKVLGEVHRQFLTYLIMHEVGHTLGLNHNMKGSQLWSPKELHNTELTHRHGLMGSVMDYPAINIAADPKQQGDYYTTKEGPYDDWAIAFGYTPFPDSSEATELAKILARSSDPRLAFGNDADDMRVPGKGMDPRANTNDMSSDAIGYAAARLQLVNGLLPKLVQRYTKPGQSWAELRARYGSLQVQRQQMIGAVSRYVGGVYVDRSFPGGTAKTKPFTPVPLSEQKRAVSVLNKYVFAPDAFAGDAAVLPYLQPQRRGFNQNAWGDDYKATNAALAQQVNGALAHLLHPATLLRMSNSRLYGNRYAVADLLQDLHAGIFGADKAGAVNVFRQNLQTEYLRFLLEIVQDKYGQYDAVAGAAALEAVQQIRREQSVAPSPNAETKAHRASLVYQIRKALEEK